MQREKEDTKRAIDEPLLSPENDLLEMNKHAKALADYIVSIERLPFTVGIFGEWGEGKTTMVNFLQHHLKSARFISFSAWPFTTSQKLWRALIFQIAKELCGIKAPSEKSDAGGSSDNPSTGNSDRLSDFLTGDFFRKRTDFELLVRELDSTDYGKISQRSPGSQMTQDELVSTVFSGALSLIGAVSPLVAGVQNLFRLQPASSSGDSNEIKLEDSLSQDSQALTKFQRIFNKMLEQKAPNERVYVFIDDLDRAQPDVALDIMESVRIALAEATRCVFIIAVDERLIAQGLRLRYKELFARERSLAITTKGQEYLEKIIQFRTRVPPRTPEQTQRLISAEFPDWTPAGDIIQTIVGNNPRRIKQYCQRLTFQKMIGSTTFPLASVPSEEAPVPGPGTVENVSPVS